MEDYDIRQYRLMLDKLDAFGTQKLPLSNLISNLDGLLNALEDTDEQWKNAFLRQWGVLEDVYANSLDKNLQEIPGDQQVLVSKAVAEIRKLVAQNM